jgi:hypothetical protein
VVAELSEAGLGDLDLGGREKACEPWLDDQRLDRQVEALAFSQGDEPVGHRRPMKELAGPSRGCSQTAHSTLSATRPVSP